MSKLRVWWIPQIGIGQTFYIPVETVEDGKKMMDILAAYDLFQLQNNVKPDYSNVGGLQMWDEEEKEWCDWFMETENDFFEDVDEYCEQCEKSEELKKFNKELYTQIDYNKIQRMIS
jgi:hypothetical protein|nr:MAG TPA: Superinfection exclusion protein [Caudoviricetes sp.]